MLGQLKHPALIEQGEAFVELKVEIERRRQLQEWPHDEYFFSSLASLVHLMCIVETSHVKYSNLHPKSFVATEHAIKLRPTEDPRPANYQSPQELMHHP
jgi:hypothetical protein